MALFLLGKEPVFVDGILGIVLITRQLRKETHNLEKSKTFVKLYGVLYKNMIKAEATLMFFSYYEN